MSGVVDRVEEFLAGWPIAKAQLEEIVREAQQDELELDRSSTEAEGN